MAKYEHFEELPVWQEAKRLYNTVLDLLEEPNVPLTSGLRGQLDRAALSVSNNIAEGFERSSTQELQSFIAIARGSAGEVRSISAHVPFAILTPLAMQFDQPAELNSHV